MFDTATSGWSSAQEVLKLCEHSERRGGAGLPQAPPSPLPLLLSSEGSPHGPIHQRTMTSSSQLNPNGCVCMAPQLYQGSQPSLPQPVRESSEALLRLRN